MIEELKRLEDESRKLEPNKEDRHRALTQINAYADDFIGDIEQSNAFNDQEVDIQVFEDFAITEEGKDISEITPFIKQKVDHPGLNPASGGHLGYIPGGGIYYSAIGDYIADVTNNYAGVYFGSPGAVQLENYLIDWMADKFNFGNQYAGNLTSGGSIANLIAMVAARDAKNINSDTIKKCVIYTSSHAHHCVKKGINLSGMREIIVRLIPLNNNFELTAESIGKQILIDKENGLTPSLIIASAGTTDIGAIDHLEAIGHLAKKHDTWFHVDGAYGGFFFLTKEGQQKLKGIEMADSLVIDPHKGLFLPYGLGAILVKDKKHLLESNSYEANYMQDAANDQVISPADVSPELTKHFRGMRMWLPLQLHGTKPFVACLNEKLLLAKYFHQKIQEISHFKTGPEPRLSVVTYRFEYEDLDNDEFNQKLVKAIQKDGRIFISSTIINDQYTLRLAILSFRTHKSTIDLTLKVLKEKSEMLLKELING